MALSVLATEFAMSIRNHPWSALSRLGGNPDSVRLNTMWVTAKVLQRNDPNFDVFEFSQLCGCTGHSRRFIEAGIVPYPKSGDVT